MLSRCPVPSALQALWPATFLLTFWFSTHICCAYAHIHAHSCYAHLPQRGLRAHPWLLYPGMFPWNQPSTPTSVHILCPNIPHHGCCPTSFPHQEAATEMARVGTSLVVQWLRLWAPNAGSLGLITGQGTRSHMLQGRVHISQLKILNAATKSDDPTCHNWDLVQPNKYIFLKELPWQSSDWDFAFPCRVCWLDPWSGS